jgi:outer membrane autotransporter protein
MTGSGGGVRVGALSEIDESTKIGVIAEYQKSYFSLPDRSSTSNSDSFMVGVFGEREFDQFVLSGGITNSWHLINTDRDVRLTGLNDDLTANYGAQTFGGWVELSKEFEGNDFAYAPFANLSLAHHTTSGFTENGGTAALRSTGDASQSAVSTVGIRVQTHGAFENTQYTARGMIGWQHSFTGAPTMDLQFASGGNSFNVAGVPESRDALVVETGVNFEIGTNANLDLSYNGLFSNTGQHHSANIDMRVGF